MMFSLQRYIQRTAVSVPHLASRRIVFCALFFAAFFSKASSSDFDRTQRPEGQAAPKISLPHIQKTTLKNGLQLWLVEHHELPLVAMNLVFQSGAAFDGNKPGLAAMTADLLDEGTSSRDALSIADELESIGASLSVSSNFDGSYVSVNTLKKHLGKALEIFFDVLVNASFPDKEFQRLRKQRLTTLLQQRDQPTAIASNAFNYILYGAEHPYGNNITGNEVSLKDMLAKDCENFYRTHYLPNNATLFVVGDITLREISSQLETALINWKAKEVPAMEIPKPKTIPKRMVYLIDKPEAAQSEIRIGYPALARSTPDFFSVTLMNRALGGQFASRINMNLREKHGYTYGARSNFSFVKGDGPFVASAGVVTAKTDSSLIEFFYELDRTYNDGITSEELSFVKKGAIGGFALTFETPSQIASAMQSIVLYGLPENYFEHYLMNIENVTLAEVQTVSQKYLNTSKMAVVVVGDLKTIRDGILALQIGDVVYCDVDGKPIR
jgi:predicted Zn-dependent peptidase